MRCLPCFRKITRHAAAQPAIAIFTPPRFHHRCRRRLKPRRDRTADAALLRP
jgi:hypothetical protein